MVKAIIFDLDGTVLDTLDDLAGNMNAALAAFGMPTHPVDDFCYFIGNGVYDLVKKTLPPERREDEAFCKQVAAVYQENYKTGWNRHTKPYAGIDALLAELCARHMPMAVLSNKPHYFTDLCIRHYFPTVPFHPILGQRDTHPRKPDPTVALEMAAEMGFSPAEILYVGDTSTDMKTAVNAGMIAVGVTWGFRTEQELRETGAQHIIHHPAELLTLC